MKNLSYLIYPALVYFLTFVVRFLSEVKIISSALNFSGIHFVPFFLLSILDLSLNFFIVGVLALAIKLSMEKLLSFKTNIKMMAIPFIVVVFAYCNQSMTLRNAASDLMYYVFIFSIFLMKLKNE